MEPLSATNSEVSLILTTSERQGPLAFVTCEGPTALSGFGAPRANQGPGSEGGPATHIRKTIISPSMVKDLVWAPDYNIYIF